MLLGSDAGFIGLYLTAWAALVVASWTASVVLERYWRAQGRTPLEKGTVRALAILIPLFGLSPVVGYFMLVFLGITVGAVVSVLVFTSTWALRSEVR